MAMETVKLLHLLQGGSYFGKCHGAEMFQCGAEPEVKEEFYITRAWMVEQIFKGKGMILLQVG